MAATYFLQFYVAGYDVQTNTVALAADTWTRVTFTITIPSGSGVSSVGVRFLRNTGSNAASAATVDMTGALAALGTVDPGYFDGSTLDTIYWDYGWTGTAHASTSIKSSLNVQARTAEVLTKYSTPAKTITSIRWNAAEDPALGAALDIQDRVRVEFQGGSQDSRIVGIKHDITGGRWIMELELVKS